MHDIGTVYFMTWWRHQMETFFALLAICAGNSPVSGEFPAQRPVTRSFDVFFDVRLIKRLSKHSRGWWFGTLSHPLWRHRNEICLRIVLLCMCYLIWLPQYQWSRPTRFGANRLNVNCKVDTVIVKFCLFLQVWIWRRQYLPPGKYTSYILQM